ncbi:epoxide hydrolase family protein [Actinoallomurus sp. CA-142502]|uniref:epoxide hydrolase family protein n=1 Tax=Actinoallomurus sp. CA-142502 TaxID=3239885 RepID=UPI003D91A0AA
MIEPFHIAVADEVLEDLAARLERTRPPSPQVLDGGESPETVERIEDLVAYWRSGYDWRAQEARLNAVPHFRAAVGDARIHFVHVPGSGPDPLPLLLTNGWPSSFVEYLGVLDRLTDPAAYGGDPADAFSVVVPALPGYGFSDPYPGRLDRAVIAGLFDRLMVDGLGYASYVAHGDDIGGGVVNRLGMYHAATVRAIQTTNWIRPADPTPRTPEEVAYVEAGRRWERTRGAYAHVQATRPQILAYGLNDSPSGLAAWVLEKWLTWSDPATRGRLADDDLLTNVMTYWVTGSIGSSSRLYAVDAVPPPEAVSVPSSVLLTREPELPIPPEPWLRRAYPRMARLATTDEGGHFLALESPEQFVRHVREAFRPYRSAYSTSTGVPPVIRTSSS